MRIVIAFLLVVGMLTPTRGWTQENNQEGFIRFVMQFAEDDSIQRKNTRFPIEYYEWLPGMESDRPDTSYIYENDWEPLRLHSLPHGGVKESDGGAYAQYYEVDPERAIIQIRGVDNGLHTNLVFFRHEGSWLLVRIEEYST